MLCAWLTQTQPTCQAAIVLITYNLSRSFDYQRFLV